MMMNFKYRIVQILRISIKEWMLLLRNPHGLIVLFFMPAVFVLVMSFTLKNTLVARVEMPVTGWVLETDTASSKQWALDWHDRYGGIVFASRTALQVALKERKVDAGVIVLKEWLGEDSTPRSNQIEIWLANRVQPAAAARLRAELAFSVMQAGLKITAAQAGPFASVLLNSSDRTELLEEKNSPSIRYLYEIESGRKMTAVQQSVPAWLIFGMFFVVIPISGVLIQERKDGTLNRLASFGVKPLSILCGKFFAFMILNCIQLGFMLGVGHWVVPFLGGDTLYLDISVPWFILIVACTSTSAVSLALLIATITRSFDHAAAVGSGLNVILGAIAGIMVPRMLMPPRLQLISEWSPMGWALDGMQAVFLGSPDGVFMLTRAGLLLGLSFLLMIICWLRLR